MKSCRLNINGFFCAALCAFILAASGCKTSEQKRIEDEKTLISLHLETNPDNTSRNTLVPLYRTRPEMINVTKDPFLQNANILGANIVDLEGGFGIQIQFDSHGTKVLEMYTARFRGKRIAVNCAFPPAPVPGTKPDKVNPDLRWLAAPRITRTLQDGSFVFTPDATREECERIVRGINNFVKRARKDALL